MVLASFECGRGREFESMDGRKIEATLIGHRDNGKTIVLQMGTKEYALPITKFSIDDQVYIMEWVEKNPGKMAVDFRFYADLREERSSSSKVDYDERLQVFPRTYSISMSNNSGGPVSGMRVELQVLIEDWIDTLGGFRHLAYSGTHRSAKLLRLKGTLENVDLGANERLDMDTPTFTIEKYVDRDGGSVDIAKKDRVMGVWIRVYIGDTMVEDWQLAENNAVLKDIPWEDSGTGRVQLLGGEKTYREFPISSSNPEKPIRGKGLIVSAKKKMSR
ncbi:MAG: hypothetical protein AAGA58_02550 [Verrucomicrobiota bacterium]